MKKIVVISILFSIDRLSKIYILNLQESGIDIDFYIFSFLNFYLVWNTGIGFGLASMETSAYYHMLTLLILFVNIALIFILVRSKGIYSYLIAIVIAGSLGNLLDRMYYYAVPDLLIFILENIIGLYLMLLIFLLQ